MALIHSHKMLFKNKVIAGYVATIENRNSLSLQRVKNGA